jgi:hypothetical protein
MPQQIGHFSDRISNNLYLRHKNVASSEKNWIFFCIFRDILRHILVSAFLSFLEQDWKKKEVEMKLTCQFHQHFHPIFFHANIMRSFHCRKVFDKFRRDFLPKLSGTQNISIPFFWCAPFGYLYFLFFYNEP